jgi:hypothetical protein
MGHIHIETYDFALCFIKRIVVVEPRHQLLAECEQLATRASHDSDYGRRLRKLLWYFSFIGFPPKRL